jgi:hypothetical protein
MILVGLIYCTVDEAYSECQRIVKRWRREELEMHTRLFHLVTQVLSAVISWTTALFFRRLSLSSRMMRRVGLIKGSPRTRPEEESEEWI